jgi:hypothetical protein
VLVVASGATKTSDRPSGETTVVRSKKGLDTGGVATSKRMTCGAASLSDNLSNAITPAITATASAPPAAAHASQRRRGGAACVAATDAVAPLATHFNCLPTSRAVCHRSSGDFARQPETTCSSASGVNGWIDESGAGSCSMIAAITLT